jgi:hypothetical protein
MCVKDLLSYFDNKKSIEKLYDIYLTINTICFELDIIPIYTKDTFNATDIMINAHSLSIDYIIEYVTNE